MMKNRGKMLVSVLVGNALLAFSVCAFIIPNRFMLGGSTGITLTVQHWIPVSLSSITAVTNTFLFGLGLVFLGKKFAMTSLFSTLLYPVVLAVFEKLPLGQLFGGNALLAAVSAGILMGAGIGLVIRAGGSTGGMDIPPCILQKYRGIPVGTSMMVFDILVVLMQISYSGASGILYSAVIVLLTSFTVNKTVAWRWSLPLPGRQQARARIAG